MEVIRAIETWQQAGAYYVRIQAMAKKHHITLRQEFDDHDGPDTKYIVITDADFPIATARMYPLDAERMMIGRVVVLPEYHHQGTGTIRRYTICGKKSKVIPSARCGWKRQSEDQRMAASVFHLRRNVVK